MAMVVTDTEIASAVAGVTATEDTFQGVITIVIIFLVVTIKNLIDHHVKF